MKKLLILIPLFLFNCSSIDDVTPDETFIKYFGDEAFFEVRDMIVVDNEGDEEIVILARRSGEFDRSETTFNGARFYIVHLDADGKLIQEKLLDFDLQDINDLTDAARITATPTGYLVVGTHTQDFANVDNDPLKIAWAELDSDFEAVGSWNEIGDDINHFVGVDIALMTDGGVLIAGYTNKNGTNDYFYKKVGGTEDEWERTQTRPNSDDQLVRALALSNGSYALVGRTDALSNDGEGGINIERTIIDVEGVIQNSAVYGLTGVDIDSDDIPYGVIERPGGFTIVGTTISGSDRAPFLMNVDLVGASSTEVQYWNSDSELNSGLTNSGITGSAFGVTRMATNDLMVVGEVDGFDLEQDIPTLNDNGKEMMVFTTDQTGNRNSDIRQFGLVNGNETAVRTVALSDGSVLIAGNYDFGGGLQQIAVLKINTDGRLKQ